MPAGQLAERAAYEFFTGLDSRGVPAWTSDISERAPVFSDPENGVMLTSVTYNAGLGRYLLVTQQRSIEPGGYIGIYESGAPWGPWSTVLFEDAWELGLQKRQAFGVLELFQQMDERRRDPLGADLHRPGSGQLRRHHGRVRYRVGLVR